MKLLNRKKCNSSRSSSSVYKTRHEPEQAPPVAADTFCSTTRPKSQLQVRMALVSSSFASSSLGTGCFSQSQHDGSVRVEQFSSRTSRSSSAAASAVLALVTSTSSTSSTTAEQEQQQQQERREEPVFLRHAASFLRVADLQQHNDDSLRLGDSSPHSCQSIKNSNGGRLIPHFHHSSIEAPPGILLSQTQTQHQQQDSNNSSSLSGDGGGEELWIALDDGCQMHTPVAPAAVAALVKFGLATVLDRGMWKPADKHSAKLSSEATATTTTTTTTSSSSWHTDTFSTQSGRPCPPGTRALSQADNDAVLVWSGRFHHSHYGSDLPCVRAAATINMSAQALFELLLDSTRVQEYNAMSLGRTDLLILQNEMEEDDNGGGGVFGGVTKVARSETRPPLIRKTLQFTSLLHGRKLQMDHHQDVTSPPSYLLVSRAVSLNDSNSSNNDNSSSSVLHSEILMGCNVIRPIRGKEESQCLFVSVNHVRSPMIPMIIAKRIGLQAAANFIHDLRRCCVSSSSSSD